MDDVHDEMPEGAPQWAQKFVASATVAAPSRRGQLEVSQCWGELLIETLAVPLSDETGPRKISLTMGARTAPFWRLLGVEMGAVPRPLGAVLPLVMPLWSDVSEEPLDDFSVPASLLPGETEAHLVETREDGELVVVAPAGWSLQGGEPLPDGSTTKVLVPGETLTVSRDHHHFVVRLSEVQTRVEARTEALADTGFYSLVATLMFIAAIAGIGLSQLPEPRHVASRGLDEDYVVMVLDAKPPPHKVPPGAKAGSKAKGKEGERGEKTAKDKRSGDDKPPKDAVQDAGLLAAFQDDAMASLNEASLNPGLAAGVRGLIGPRGVSRGTGWGRRGMDPGGGGEIDGIGGLGPRGDGPGRGPGGPGGDGIGKEDGEIPDVAGEPTLIGSMPRHLVDEVVKRNLPMIRYCYERELQKIPGLGGKVSVKFVIAKDGTVSSASLKESTLGNPAAEQCVVGRFMKMQFPTPKGGGIVVVTYPFHFNPGR